MMNLRRDFWVGLILTALGVFFLAATGDIRISEDNLVGPRVVPQVVAGLIVALGLVLALGALLGGRAVGGGVQLPTAAAAARALGVLLAGGLFVWAFGRLGYPAATALAALLVFWLFGIRPVWRAALYAVIAAAGYWLVFVQAMGTFVPAGRWFDSLAALGF